MCNVGIAPERNHSGSTQSIFVDHVPVFLKPSNEALDVFFSRFLGHILRFGCDKIQLFQVSG